MTRSTIFISYSRKDEKEKDALLSHLGVLSRAGLVELWSDDRIGAGADWKAEIDQTIAQAEVAILLITANFLTSDFILDEEVPALLQRRESEGLVIFPVIARACAWRAVNWLAKMQVRPRDGRAIWRVGGDVDAELAAIAEEVALIVREGVSDLSIPEQDHREDTQVRPSTGSQVTRIEIGDVDGDISGNIAGRDIIEEIHGDKVVGDKITLRGPTYITGTPPQPPHPATLAAAEQSYRERIKERFGEDVPYYIPLAGETTEVTPTEPKAPRSVRRRRQRAMAEYHELIQDEKEIKRVKLDDLREAVTRYPCLILLGDPGSGKTTALENLAYQFSVEGLSSQGKRVLTAIKRFLQKQQTKGQTFLPVPLRLSEFRPGMTLIEFITQSWGGSEQAGYWNAPQLAANLRNYLEAGRLFFLFDALNEMPRQNHQKQTQALRGFINDWSPRGNRFLVTCRVLDYGEELAGLQRIEVQPLNSEQIEVFLQNELPDNWVLLWTALKESDAQSINRQSLLELARNPYLLTMIIDIFVIDGRLGRNQGELMARFTQILLEWARQKTPVDKWLEATVQQDILSMIAFEAQTLAGFGTMISMDQVIAAMPNKPPLDRILTLAASANIIEMPVDRSSVRFYHQLLQEYFAAHHMLKQKPDSLAGRWRWQWLEAEMPPVGRRGALGPLPPPPPTGWEETTILAAALAPENDDQLVRALTQINPVLAGRCLYEGQAKVDKAIRQGVIDALLGTIAQPEVALRVRIAAGDVLGYLGDPRLGEMVTVPAGKFLMGEGKEQHKPYLPEYQIGKYPLTNAEYGRFIEAGGYKDKRWWTKAGWAEKKQPTDEDEPWTEPRYRQGTRYNKPNQPVVGVSWYEAVAYCRWLSAETGRQYRLLTEAEWEKAARGVDGREFPWGNEFEASRLNEREGEQVVWTTTPVGIYPTGVSPFGAFDCAGNVQEWCATKQGKSYPYDVQEDEWVGSYLDGPESRVLRGGSWYLFRFFARCSFRFSYHPRGGDYGIGFRVVVPPI